MKFDFDDEEPEQVEPEQVEPEQDEPERDGIPVAGEPIALSKAQQVGVAFRRYEQNLVAMREKAKAHLVVDDITNVAAVAMAGQAKAAGNAIEKERKVLVGPANDYVKSVNQFAKPYSEGFEEIEAGLKTKVTRFIQEKEKERLERQRLANEETARLQAEIDNAASEAGEASLVVVTPVIEMAAKATRTDSGSASLRSTWTFAITDFALLPDQYKQIDRVAINNAVKGGTRQIPGVNIYRDQSVQIRAANIPKWDDNEKF